MAIGRKIPIVLTAASLGFLSWFVFSQAKRDLPLDKIKLPPGFSIGIYASGVPNARSMTLSPNGTVFVGSMDAGNVYAIPDKDKNYHADEVIRVASGLNMPNGVAFRDRSLYVAENQQGIEVRQHRGGSTTSPETGLGLWISADRETSWLEIHRVWAGWSSLCACRRPMQYLPGQGSIRSNPSNEAGWKWL
jgi:hypothetical protein